MSQKVKTRFAPSPTGDLHIGGLRTALYNYLFAKKHGGEFLLRIEDTDRVRFQESSVQSVLEGTEWIGIKYDNKDIIYQSEHRELYEKYANQLIEAGHAYRCFCEAKRLEQMREEQKLKKQAPKYDRTCLTLSAAEIKKKLDAGEPYVVRLKVIEGKTKFKDLVRGEVEFNHQEIDDQILIKSDGFPTYHLANVIDDHRMGVTHVIRAEEWLPSTPKHIMLYKMLGWREPEWAHLPLILAPDRSKLSKRHGATSVIEFKDMGYLPEAILNYIAFLGWNPGGEQEIFSLEELEQEFDLSQVNKAGAVFDREKLDWMNGYYLRQLDLDKFAELCLPYLKEQNYETSWEYVKQVVALEQERIKRLDEIVSMTKYFFEEPEYETELLKWCKSDLATAKERLQFLLEELNKVPQDNWTRGALEQFILELIEAHELDNGVTLWPLRVALTGRDKSPSPFEVAEVLGKEKSLERIQKALEKIKD